MKSEWTIKKLADIAEFNPRESLPKGVMAKKIAMDKLTPFCRDISSYKNNRPSLPNLAVIFNNY